MATSKMEQAERKLDQVAAMLNAQELAELSGGFALEVYSKAMNESRVEIAEAVEAQFLRRTGRSTYRGESPDQCIIDLLTEQPEVGKDGEVIPPFITDEKLRALGVDFATDGVSDEFRAGIRFALLLVGNTEYEA